MNLDEALRKVTKGSTNKWAKVRKAEERQRNRMYNRRYYMYSDKIYIKEVAYKVMKQAYMEASDNGTLPANARQIMYSARPYILEEATSLREINKDKFPVSYFTQILLPGYIDEHPGETAGWNVVFDARGHLFEPHTEKEVKLGTIDVRNYLHESKNHVVDNLAIPTVDGGDSYPTKGPKNRYGAILFIEKEGFNELFKQADIARKYDLCIMSTKGMSTTAARELVDEICNDNVTLFVLRDFDKAGFSIASTLQRDTRRYYFRNHVNVVDMGLRLKHVKKYNLQSEPVSYGKTDPVPNLVENGASQEEINFLCSDKGDYCSGQRVELNALGSRNMLDLIDNTLKKHGVKKIIPDDETLKDAYHRATLAYRLNAKLEEIADEFKEDANNTEFKATQIKNGIKKMLKETPTMSWDDAIREIVEKKEQLSTE